MACNLNFRNDRGLGGVINQEAMPNASTSDITGMANLLKDQIKTERDSWTDGFLGPGIFVSTMPHKDAKRGDVNLEDFGVAEEIRCYGHRSSVGGVHNYGCCHGCTYNATPVAMDDGDKKEEISVLLGMEPGVMERRSTIIPRDFDSKKGTFKVLAGKGLVKWDALSIDVYHVYGTPRGRDLLIAMSAVNDVDAKLEVYKAKGF
jgi:hypothetical protein